MCCGIQEFNTNNGLWTTLSRSVPSHFGRLAAALYDDRIIVVGADFSGLFNPETGDWTVLGGGGGGRTDGGGGGGCTGVSDFGLIVDDGRLYVLGGRRYNGGQYDASNEVKSVELATVVGDDGQAAAALRSSDWHPHARLPRPSLISVCGLLNIPSEL